MLGRISVVILMLAGCASSQTDKATFNMVDAGGRCLINVGGKLFEPVAAADAIKAQVRLDNQIDLVASRAAPYRCVGAAVFHLQQAGFFEVNFRPE